MKTGLSVIAILAVSSHLSFADSSIPENVASGGNTVADSAAEQAQGDNSSTITSTLPLMSDQVGASLESKLDARMEFDFGAQPDSERAIASID